MKRLLKTVFIISYIAMILAMSYEYIDRGYVNILNRGDEYTRDRVFKLIGDKGSCSGFQSKAPSGKIYIVTAAHCAAVSSTDTITAIDEQGMKYFVKIVAKSVKDDIMILDGANDKVLRIARRIGPHEAVHTMTHGKGFPSYRTDGELLEETSFKIPMKNVETPEDEEQCVKDGGEVASIFFDGNVCVINLVNMISTAAVLPGSSGGAVLNSDNEIIGVVNTGSSDGLSGMVPLHVIQKFLSDK